LTVHSGAGWLYAEFFYQIDWNLITEEKNGYGGTHKSDSKTDAQRVFEELLRKTQAYLKQKASLESEGRKQDGVLKKNCKD
jgi:hypothetical protein